MKRRKTIEVAKILGLVNAKLALATLSQDEKSVLCSLLEDVLMATENYHGFNFITWLEGGYERWVEAGKPEDRTPFLEPEYDRRYYGREQPLDSKSCPLQLTIG
jgi:hypothetical protein